MATYLKHCVGCGQLLAHDVRRCPVCDRAKPFVHRCPTCHQEVRRRDLRCAGCGRSLRIACPTCGEKSFVRDRCAICGAGLTRPLGDAASPVALEARKQA